MILGLGIDLFEVARLERELLLGGGESALCFFTAAELAESARRAQPVAHLAARFAGKEAVVKALALDGSLGLPWRRIEILDDSEGQPEVHLHGALAAAAAGRGVRRLRVALAETPQRAAAGAVAES